MVVLCFVVVVEYLGSRIKSFEPVRVSFCSCDVCVELKERMSLQYEAVCLPNKMDQENY